MPFETSSRLSTNDSLVLAALFDPETSLATAPAVEKPEDDLSNALICSSVEQCVLPEERVALQSLSVQDPSLRSIEDALHRLGQICEQVPNNASVWCNRAQATRLYLQKSYCVEDQVCQNDTLQILLRKPTLLQRIFDDLDRAITLATPTTVSVPSASKPGNVYVVPPAVRKRVLAAAHAHKGHLLWQFSRAEFELKANEIPRPFTGMDRSSLEEIASQEFALAGRYGNQVAQRISVLTNPYAKLCGNIVKEALKREMEEHSIDCVAV